MLCVMHNGTGIVICLDVGTVRRVILTLYKRRSLKCSPYGDTLTTGVWTAGG